MNESVPLRTAPTTVLVVGLGSIGKRHTEVVRHLWPHCRIVVMRRASSATPVAHGFITVHEIAHAIAEQPSLAVIASPASTHLEHLTALVDAGIPTLVEKPLAVRSEGMLAVLERARVQGIPVAVGYNLRFSETLRTIRTALAAGHIGRPLHAQLTVGQYLPDWRPGTDHRASISADPTLGGGVLHELSHEIDVAHWLFGSIRTVRAHTATLGELGIAVADTAHLIIEHTRHDAHAPLATSITMDFLRRDATRRVIVVGSEGTLEGDLVVGSVRHFDAATHAWSSLLECQPEQNDTYIAEWKDFAAAVAERRDPVCSGWDGLATLVAIEAAVTSAASGRAVAL